MFRKSEPLPVSVVCSIHPWERARWLVTDNPYAATTKPDGSFSIANVPYGEHTFRVWHERAGYVVKDLRVSVKQKRVSVPAITMRSQDLQKPAGKHTRDGGKAK